MEIKNRFYWKSNEQAFEGWNKELEQKVLIKPEELLVVDMIHVISWRHDASSSKIYSNEVHDIREEEFNVKSFKWGDLYKGKYSKETKDNFERVGWSFHKGLVAFENGEYNVYYVKGSALYEVSEALKWVDTKKFKVRLKEVKANQKGAIKWFTPVFEKGSEITQAELDAISWKPNPDLPF